MVGEYFLSKLVHDYLQVRLLDILFRILHVSHMGRGYFSVQFESTDQANALLVRSTFDFHTAMGFLARWSQGKDLAGMEAKVVVIVKFPGLLLEFTPYLQEIGSSLGFVVGDILVEHANC